MVTEAQTKAVSLFFFYAFLEEALANSATKHCLRQISKDKEIRTDADAIIYWTHYSWKKFFKKAKLVSIGLERMYVLSQDMDFEPWKQLRKEVSNDEYLATIWTCILGYHTNAISSALNITQGTINHRVSAALRKLGNFVSTGEPNAKKRA